MDFLYFNKNVNKNIIPVDLALRTGCNLCASRQRSLQGLFFTKIAVLKLGNKDFLESNEKCNVFVIPVDLGAEA